MRRRLDAPQLAAGVRRRRFYRDLEKLRLVLRVNDMPEISSLAVSKGIPCGFVPG